MTAGTRKRIPVAVAMAMAEMGITHRPEPTARQIDDRIARVLSGRATDADKRQLVNDLMHCERQLAPQNPHS